MTLHASTFEYHAPTEQQKTAMARGRAAAHDYASVIEALLTDGPDKTYALRKFREVAMWVNVALTRNPDGAPREE